MTNEQAYGEWSYGQRALTRYGSGDVVRIGPAYQMGGHYAPDGSEGIYTVIRELPGSESSCGPDYYLARGYWAADSHPHWDVLCKAARLILVQKGM